MSADTPSHDDDTPPSATTPRPTANTTPSVGAALPADERQPAAASAPAAPTQAPDTAPARLADHLPSPVRRYTAAHIGETAAVSDPFVADTADACDLEPPEEFSDLLENPLRLAFDIQDHLGELTTAGTLEATTVAAVDMTKLTVQTTYQPSADDPHSAHVYALLDDPHCLTHRGTTQINGRYVPATIIFHREYTYEAPVSTLDGLEAALQTLISDDVSLTHAETDADDDTDDDDDGPSVNGDPFLGPL